MVEASRGYNVQHVQKDTLQCRDAMSYNQSSGRISGGLSGFWGGASPLNIDARNLTSYDDFTLPAHNPKLATRPIYDPV